MKVRALTDLTDASGDTNLFVPSGTILNVLRDEGDFLLVEVPTKYFLCGPYSGSPVIAVMSVEVEEVHYEQLES